MKALILVPILISFLLSVAFIPKWIKKCKQTDMLWENMNRYNHPKNLAASGGIVVILAFIIGILSYIAIMTFILKDSEGITVKILSLTSVLLILAIVGLTDDLLGWKRGGLSWKFRILLAFIASIPLVVINAGNSTIGIPIFGIINLGLLYPLVLVPLAVAGTTTTFNFLAGFNGLEAGQGIIIVSFLSFVAYITGSEWLAVTGLIMVASLIGFYIYNKYPAKVLPGDIMTWSVGALIGSMAILGNFEKIAVFVFIPYILEFFLKVRGGFSPAKQSFGVPNKDNSLEMPYDGKIYGVTHISIWLLKKFKSKVYESDVVYFIMSIQILLCLIALLIFRSNLFL